MTARVVVTGARSSVSVHSIIGILQTYTGLPLPEAQALLDRARRGERVELEMDDEYAAYDLASLLGDMGVEAEVPESG
ncbi:MAG: hypothetical protein AVDCRST_MAG89-3538 [uncultured Gemmatimonadetes bacterium]|uniref:Uncharacterized protein n=1 Tax=uncultured Gemmatimonadota bacterium TaxID=203437 RepID=A0A6J4MKE7_9BACT|nr:MAG: hypothetical protein AVDCRST_MAG89-3538 [uncultured Gemmatimonadota bacterium]